MIVHDQFETGYVVLINDDGERVAAIVIYSTFQTIDPGLTDNVQIFCPDLRDFEDVAERCN